MKKLLFLLLFIPLVSFSQDFRKMNFGESIETLTEKYPDVEFEVDGQDNIQFAFHSSLVSGIKTTITYIFEDKKLVSGIYLFDTESSKDGDERVKDYKNVSERLSEKYKMEEYHNWHQTTWKNNPNYHGHAFSMGQVDFLESYKNEDLVILHLMEYKNNIMLHMVNYSTREFSEKNIAELEEENEF